MHRIGLCVAIWETGEWPEEWTFSTLIPLPKKFDLKKCENYRTMFWFPMQARSFFGSYWAEFRQGMGTRDKGRVQLASD